MATLGERLKLLREQKGITQRELSEFMGYKTTRPVQYFEANERPLDHHALIKLADFFNVSLDYLVGRSNDPSPPTKEI
ncbi:helix-turn-helix domain-containing protein [Alicyclobacillus tolerans]|uniref:helix-turn-helix domain-containing protein n=1 Tax=Alicyclobacillus tolerans TaxID=90970 RepID=UPI003B79829E